ncbi:uncharacterized protein EAE98_008657 [Botrytis deweyae]|uniref:Uncharacterized protein n=1 Tax=Botrytis deweyae TaxID=2478750 RepID=A0ABQ7IDR0_9HELO|nr:uncharacterized protein EAE98_008657 [Botrytis deweyae]KAF7921231.1 hypothetical protein EAE98_008657 [Botrytis deweyae]
MLPLTRDFWTERWHSYNTALEKCNHCKISFALYDCGCVRMTLPHFDNDPLSKSCRIYPISKDSSKPEPKPTTRPKIFYKRKNHGCGRVNRDPKDKCLWDGKEVWDGKEKKQCSDCEDHVEICKKCTRVKMGPAKKCRKERDRYDQRKPRKHMPHFFRRDGDKFCSPECAKEQADFDKEQRILEEENARRRSENEARKKEEAKQHLKFVEDYERNKRAKDHKGIYHPLMVVFRHHRLPRDRQIIHIAIRLMLSLRHSREIPLRRTENSEAVGRWV